MKKGVDKGEEKWYTDKAAAERGTKVRALKRQGSSLKIEQRDKDSTAKAVRSAQRKTPKILLNFLKSSFK